MNVQEFIRYQEQSFDSFCETLIRNEGKDARKVIANREKHEIAFVHLPDIVISRLCQEDNYAINQSTFMVGDKTVIVEDMVLAQALSTLPANRRDIILLFYFLDWTDKQISKAMDLSLDATYYRRQSSLKKLRSVLEELNNGE